MQIADAPGQSRAIVRDSNLEVGMQVRMVPLCFTMLFLASCQPDPPAPRVPTTCPATQPDPVEVEFRLPKPICTNPSTWIPHGIALPADKPRRTWAAPAGTELLSHRKPVTSSEAEPIIGTVDLVTDGDKEASDGSYVELGAGLQWVQIDLGTACEVTGVLLWHHWGVYPVYRDVVIQLSNDPEFKQGVVTVFNNDTDNSSKLGKGTDREYLESFQGKLIEVASVKARYVRCHANGNIFSDQTHYTEVEVYGIPTVNPK